VGAARPASPEAGTILEEPVGCAARRPDRELVVLLASLVLRRVPLTRSAWIAAGVAAVLAMAVFGLSPVEVGVAVARGAWTAAWILLIVLPALLLFEVLDRSGALDHLAAAADHIAPTEGRRLLLLAWILPSFLQGAAGFGAPIAMSAPMLVRRGMAPVAAVAACLIGYQWSVTFGSMGSSYFMAEATARLSTGRGRLLRAAGRVILAFNAVLSGLLVLTRGAALPGDLWRTLALGTVMGAVLVAVVTAQPALGSTAAGLAGLVAAWWLLPRRGARDPASTDAMVAALPLRGAHGRRGDRLRGPAGPCAVRPGPRARAGAARREAAFGFATPDAAVTPVFRPLLHPLPYVLLAVVVAVLAYRRRGWWSPGTTRVAVRAWGRGRERSPPPSLGLTILAAVLTERGWSPRSPRRSRAGSGRRSCSCPRRSARSARC
jgi:lactate permease